MYFAFSLFVFVICLSFAFLNVIRPFWLVCFPNLKGLNKLWRLEKMSREANHGTLTILITSFVDLSTCCLTTLPFQSTVCLIHFFNHLFSLTVVIYPCVFNPKKYHKQLSHWPTCLKANQKIGKQYSIDHSRTLCRANMRKAWLTLKTTLLIWRILKSKHFATMLNC